MEEEQLPTDHEAFLRLFTRFEGNLRAYVASLLPTREGVDDVMQESSVVLWRRFSDFDQAVDAHGLEKIKTIGDCYMVASGVPEPRADHALVLTQMALEMQEHINAHEYRGHRLDFRMGINSGPVVAGVIGRQKFIYDLWGDAVNTASRMESNGKEGSIQITEATYDLIKEEFICEPQGTIHVKGKGKMDVWHVLGENADSTAAAI